MDLGINIDTDKAGKTTYEEAAGVPGKMLNMYNYAPPFFQKKDLNPDMIPITNLSNSNTDICSQKKKTPRSGIILKRSSTMKKLDK